MYVWEGGVSLLAGSERLHYVGPTKVRISVRCGCLLGCFVFHASDVYLVCCVRLVCCSYKQVRQRPEFADRSIITMVQQEPHNSSGSGGDQAVSRDLAQLAELDTFMLAEVMAVAQQGYSR